MECELCSRPAQLVKAEVEGTLLSVCNSCTGFGRKVEAKIVDMPKKKPAELGESSINPDFAKIIKNARGKLGMNLEELGKKISEKASVLERVERGMRPTDALARKLEKALKIKMLGYQEE